MKSTARRIARARRRFESSGSIRRRLAVDCEEEAAPARAARVGDVVPLRGGRRHEQLLDPDRTRVLRSWLQGHQDHERYDHGPRPVGHLVEVEREPTRQQHDLNRHHRHRAPGDLAEQRERDPGEHVAAGGAAMRQNCLARAPHVRRLRIVADQLQGIVGLDAGAEIEIAAGIERPAAVVGLAGAQVNPDLPLERRVDLVEEMLEQDVFGRDARIGLELEEPMPVGTLQLHQALARLRDHRAQILARHRDRIDHSRQVGRSPSRGHTLAEARLLRRLHHSLPERATHAMRQSLTKVAGRQASSMSHCVAPVAVCCPHASEVTTRPSTGR